MIQRIQTIYLALAAALSGLLMKGPIVTLIGQGGEAFELTFKGIFLIRENAGSMIEKCMPLTILVILVATLFLLAVALFKRRKLQIRVTVLATLLNLGIFLLILFYIFYSGRKIEAEMIFSVKLVFPLAGSVLGYLAFRNILKDILIIKSYDRIR